MKNISLLIFCACVLLSCEKNKKAVIPEGADITIHFTNKVAGQAIENGKYAYTNAAGNIYSISLLKYYISHVVLITSDQTEVKLNNYDLIDAFDPANFSNIVAKSLPNATYTSIRFSLGVDSLSNHSGAQDGDLDPVYNMIWNWNTGYIFFKHEGKFINNLGDTTDLQYHLGTDLAYTVISVPIQLTVDGTAKTLNMAFDVNKMYNAPVIDFNNGNIHHSTLAADKPWINDMVSNAQQAFTFLNVE